ncbi:hypothetical protein PENTCL1PPCAC_13378, partial [Pristionchus entomophagus]
QTSKQPALSLKEPKEEPLDLFNVENEIAQQNFVEEREFKKEVMNEDEMIFPSELKEEPSDVSHTNFDGYESVDLERKRPSGTLMCADSENGEDTNGDEEPSV